MFSVLLAAFKTQLWSGYVVWLKHAQCQTPVLIKDCVRKESLQGSWVAGSGTQVKRRTQLASVLSWVPLLTLR